MKSERFTFLIVENAIDVCEGIKRRMAALGYCNGIREAIERIKLTTPHLIFLDWSLNGGSAFEILQFIQNLPGYNPYIIFNTGYQSDHPEIPEAIINDYKVDKYLVKPFWENLRIYLSNYLKEAEEKALESFPKPKIIWLENEKGEKISLQTDRIVCIVQNPNNPRRRNLYTDTQVKEITIPVTWEKCYELLNVNSIDYFITKSREHLVVRKFIERFEKPYVRLKNFSFRVEVVKEKLRNFEDWLVNNNIK
jgi:two-component system, LytTR family, response regulator